MSSLNMKLTRNLTRSWFKLAWSPSLLSKGSSQFFLDFNFFAIISFWCCFFPNESIWFKQYSTCKTLLGLSRSCSWSALASGSSPSILRDRVLIHCQETFETMLSSHSFKCLPQRTLPCRRLWRKPLAPHCTQALLRLVVFFSYHNSLLFMIHSPNKLFSWSQRKTWEYDWNRV